MQPKPIAFVLILLGLAGLYFGLVGFQQKTATIEIGGMTASASENRTSPPLAMLGGALVVGGIVILARGGRN